VCERSEAGYAGTMSVTALQLQEFLAGVDYPISREDLVRWAQENGAGTNLIQRLRSLPADQFTSPGEVGSAFDDLG